MLKKESKPHVLPTGDIRTAFLGGVISRDEDTFQKILVKLIDPLNPETKTEIHDPLALTRLLAIADWGDAEGAKKTAATLRAFAHEYRVNMISYNRQSRKEVVQALTEGLKQERTMAEKLRSKISIINVDFYS